MLQYRDAAPATARPDAHLGAVQVTAPLRAQDPLSGPARHRDPVDAMAADVAEVVGARGCVEEVDLLQRGWTAGEIAAHFPGAVGRAQGRTEGRGEPVAASSSSARGRR